MLKAQLHDTLSPPFLTLFGCIFTRNGTLLTSTFFHEIRDLNFELYIHTVRVWGGLFYLIDHVKNSYRYFEVKIEKSTNYNLQKG